MPKSSLLEAAEDESLGQTDHIRFQFISFKDDRLFRKNKNNSKLHHPVIMASLSKIKVQNLETPFRYMVPIRTFDPFLAIPVCVFWDNEGKISLSIYSLEHLSSSNCVKYVFSCNLFIIRLLIGFLFNQSCFSLILSLFLFLAHKWSRTGLETFQNEKGEIFCESNHLTSFSVLLDPVGTPVMEGIKPFLSIITYIGITLSTVALVATIATFTLFR